MLHSMLIFTFPVLDWKYHFWTNLAQKFKFIFPKLFFVARLVLYIEFDDDVHVSCIETKMPFLGNFCPKSRNVLLKMDIAIICLG